MTERNRIVQLDPFFDGETGGYGDAQPLPQRDTGRPVTPETQYGYRPAAGERTAAGTPVTGVMRPGPAGLNGTIIPRSTMGGIPQGTSPHVTSDIEVVIDPHIAGQSSRVRLGDINQQTVAAGIAMARDVTPEPTSIETLRLRGAATMHGIAATVAGAGPALQEQPLEMAQPVAQQPVMHHQSQQPVQPYVAQPVQPMPPQAQQPVAVQQFAPQPAVQQEIPAPTLQTAAHAAPQRRVAPLAAFNQQPPAPEPTRELRAIDLRDEAPAGSRAQAGPAQPTIEVVFEMEGYGTNRAYYHDVIVQPGFIILVYDNRYQGPRWFPPVAESDNPPPLAMNVTGTEEVYRVQTTGVQYAVGHLEHCTLMITETGALPPE